MAELMTQWLDTYAKHNVSAKTLDGYVNTVQTHINPSIGALAIQDLRPAHLSALYAKKLDAGASPRVVVLIHQ